MLSEPGNLISVFEKRSRSQIVNNTIKVPLYTEEKNIIAALQILVFPWSQTIFFFLPRNFFYAYSPRISIDWI